MYAACSNEQWQLANKQAYNNIAPGGWIEEVTAGIKAYFEDGSWIPGDILYSWESTLAPSFVKIGKPLDFPPENQIT